MNRSQLKSIANKTGKDIDLYNFRKQRNLVVTHNKKQKKICLNSLAIENDSKLFWETCKPYFFNKWIKTLGNINFLIYTFSFRAVTPKHVLDVISTLEITSRIQNHLAETFPYGCRNKMFPQALCKWINNSLKTRDFPDPVKLAEMTPTLKKEDSFDKDNCRWFGQSVFYLWHQKSLKKLFTSKFMATSSSTWIHCFADSDRVMVLSMHFSDCCRHDKKSLMKQVIIGQF